MTPLDVPSATGAALQLGLSRTPDGNYTCVLGGASVGPATPLSPTTLQCTAPPALAGTSASVALTGAWPGTLTFAWPLSYFGPCPNNCSVRGFCYAGACQCQSDAYGADCSVTGYAPEIDPASLPAANPLPVAIGRTLELALRTKAPGNDTWVVTSGPFSALINPTTGTLTWTPLNADSQVTVITVKVFNGFGSASATLDFLPIVAYNCTVGVAGPSHTFVPGDGVPFSGTAQYTAVSNVSQPLTGSNITLVVSGAGSWQTLTATLDAQGAFASSYVLPSWASAEGSYQVYCRHPAYTGGRPGGQGPGGLQPAVTTTLGGVALPMAGPCAPAHSLALHLPPTRCCPPWPRRADLRPRRLHRGARAGTHH